MRTNVEVSALNADSEEREFLGLVSVGGTLCGELPALVKSHNFVTS